MASRFSAARPKRDGEAFARARHGQRDGWDEDDGENSGADPTARKRVKFDVRNPSALAPGAVHAGDDDDDDYDDVTGDGEQDQFLAADVIGGTRATKRGAVNIDGYDSDSGNENFEARAEARGKKMKKGRQAEDVDLNETMDNYNKKNREGGKDEDGDEKDEIDMFGGGDDDSDANDWVRTAIRRGKAVGKKIKDVRFLDDSDIIGQELTSKSGGAVTLDNPAAGKGAGGGGSNDDDDSDDPDDERAVAAAMEEEGVDEEVGAGGLKRHAPKLDAFNMSGERQEGAFDEAGNYLRKAADAEAVHDRWLEGISKRDIRRAAAAHEARDEARRQRQRDEDAVLTADLLRALIARLDVGETALEALARLGKSQKAMVAAAAGKKVPKWKQKKQKQPQARENGDGNDGNSGQAQAPAPAPAPAAGDAMDVDPQKPAEDPRQARIKAAIDAITDSADKLLRRDFADIYDTERERLIRTYQSDTGEQWVDLPSPGQQDEDGTGEDQRRADMDNKNHDRKTWEFRWIEGRAGDDTVVQGPYDGPTMKAWQDAGYFKESVEFRPAGEDAEWSRIAHF